MSFKFSQSFSCGTKIIGAGGRVFITAEAGVAHFGDVSKAYKLIELATEAHVDAVKFQIYRTDNLVSASSGEWKDRLRSKELDYKIFVELKKYCETKNVLFFATAHDEESLDFLTTLDVPVFKIGSGELRNIPFITKIAKLNRPVFLSTGMYNLDDISLVLKIFEDAQNPNICVLHCITAYPTPPEDVNLKAINTIAKHFQVMSGYSDHTEGFHFSLAAVALGAKVIEKHITLDFDVPNAQDWKVSCGVHNLSEMVMQIRDIEKGLGDGQKKVAVSEEQSILWARKSIVAARGIATGETITEQMLAYKRPGTGIAPNEIYNVVGKKAKKPIRSDLLIQWSSLE